MQIRSQLLNSVWNLATWCGMRRLGILLKRSYPSAYGDTLFCWDDEPNVHGYVALTIDDGLCRNRNPNNNCSSMVEEVRDLLRSYNAHATFFVCSDYTTPDLALLLLHDGHELANHLKQDSSSGYYCHLAKEDFRKELLTANQIILLNLKEQQQGKVHQRPPRWFRAPQGRMTQAMAEVVQEEKMMHVLGDCYCDDWAFAEDGDIQYVAPLMLQQVQEGGSIAIFHMPERGFREASLEALREFLEGTNQMNLRCISLTEMAASAEKVEDER